MGGEHHSRHVRMLLEVEMANLSDYARIGMQSDPAQMGGIIVQFQHHAKSIDTSTFKKINISDLVGGVVQTD
jgi:two-component system, OmpR family, osmolarity sensor histidine kinase EnvZ